MEIAMRELRSGYTRWIAKNGMGCVFSQLELSLDEVTCKAMEIYQLP